MRHRLWVFAGSNGAGKSTLVRRMVRGRIPVVNPDELVTEQGHDPLAAGRRALAWREELLSLGVSFAIETTLSGRTEIDLIRRARSAGYRVNLVYIGLASVQLSILRVRARVLHGGHDVPTADLLRRFDRSLAGLVKLEPVVDRLILIDNSFTVPRLLTWRDGSETRRMAAVLPAWAEAVLKP